MPLYQIDQPAVQQLRLSSFRSERELQVLFEGNLETLLGVRFVASEFVTGDRQRGRIDTLGIDQDGTPTIVEYKKSSKENVINQGLFYLDWLVDHKGDFIVAAQEKLGTDVQISWTNPRLILVAEEFNEYDKYAVNRIGANIELWSYRLYSDGMLQLEPIFVPDASRMKLKPKKTDDGSKEKPQLSLEKHLEGKPEEVCNLMDDLRKQILELAEKGEIIEKANQMYMGYKHGKNFCEVELQQRALKIWIDIPPDELDDPRGLGRDVSKVGHYGTGQVEIKLSDPAELDYVMSLVKQSYLLTV